MKLRLILLVTLVSMFLSKVSFAVEIIPEGPWNYINGVWVKVELPDQDSPWEWVPGHWNPAGNWVPGHWKKVDLVRGKYWIPGHWDNGVWVRGHWVDSLPPNSQKKVWVPAHRGPRGRWIPGHWE
jgi:hypothetical protein